MEARVLGMEDGDGPIAKAGQAGGEAIVGSGHRAEAFYSGTGNLEDRHRE